MNVPGEGIDWFRSREREAIKLLGVADGDWFSWRDDMVALAQRTNVGSVGGTGGIARADREFELTSGANASSYQEVFWDNTTSPNPIVPSGSTGEWAIYGLLRFTGLDSATRSTFGVRNAAGSAYARLGCIGAVSAANFAFQTDNGSIDSGLTDDANWREWLVVRSGSLTTLYIDGVVRGTPADLYPSAACGPHAVAFNDSTAAVRKIGMSLVGITVPRIS